MGLKKTIKLSEGWGLIHGIFLKLILELIWDKK